MAGMMRWTNSESAKTGTGASEVWNVWILVAIANRELEGSVSIKRGEDEGKSDVGRKLYCCKVTGSKLCNNFASNHLVEASKQGRETWVYNVTWNVLL